MISSKQSKQNKQLASPANKQDGLLPPAPTFSAPPRHHGMCHKDQDGASRHPTLKTQGLADQIHEALLPCAVSRATHEEGPPLKILEDCGLHTAKGKGIWMRRPEHSEVQFHGVFKSSKSMVQELSCSGMSKDVDSVLS